MNDDPLAFVAARRTMVEGELTSAAGDASLCSISRSAGAVPGVKYLEGRLAVLMDVARAVRSGRDLADVVGDALTEWTERLMGAERRGMGTDWTGYYAGGLDELEEISSALGDHRPA